MFKSRLNSAFELKSEDEQARTKDHHDYILNSLDAMSRASNMDVIQVNDSLTFFWLKEKNKERKACILEAMDITDNEQYPEIESKKVKVINEIEKQAAKFHGETLDGINAAIKLVNKYKGSDFTVLSVMAKNIIKNENESPDFMRGYNGVLSSVQKSVKNVLLKQGKFKAKLNTPENHP